jgi:hypothetical protein
LPKPPATTTDEVVERIYAGAQSRPQSRGKNRERRATASDAIIPNIESSYLPHPPDVKMYRTSVARARIISSATLSGPLLCNPRSAGTNV